MMLVQPSTKRHLVVLNYHNHRKTLNRSEVHTFMKYAGLCRAISYPRKRDPSLPSKLEAQRDACGYRHYVADVTYWGKHSSPEISNVQVAAVRGRVGCAQVTSKHVCQGHPHFVA